MNTSDRLLLTAVCATLTFASSAGAADRTWTNSSGGDWATPSNWSDLLVPTVSDRTLFSLNNTYPVTLSSDVEVDALNVDAGAVSLSSADATSRQLKTATLSVGGGGVGHLAIANGARVRSGTYLVNSGNGSSIDLVPGGLLQVPESSGSVVSDQLRADIGTGFHGYDWQGPGITSTYAQTHPRLRVGYGFHDLTYSLIDVKLTVSGDADLNGTTNFDDLLKFAHSYGIHSNQHWYTGDFNYDGSIDFADLLSITQGYGYSLLSTGEISVNPEMASSFEADWALAQSMVPEPVSAGLLAAAGALIAGRRRA